MSTHIKLSSFLALAFLLPAAAFGTPHSAKPTFDHSGFVSWCCVKTLYPDVCYSTLSRHANATLDDPARLARIAVQVSLKQVQSFAANLTCLSRNATGATQSALADCIESMSGAACAMRDSLEKMRAVALGRAGQGFAAAMNDVQTWMSAALTSEETCSNGFEDVGDGRSNVETEVRHGVDLAWMVTSNALALINYSVNDHANL
ncbi:hypothetical protein MLD38_005421 [Melastoma candidum]|uniref:Uncharacterized protein n=1 Tax=Melastoma candidum TaxID=119954 RepID=A0ACB9RKV4_9MYRT|nr:hypothetical protein MLD38_005421 [Melastoma candidum]